jgi:dolichyl-phosphate-mannose--protein O-mannosyl transferase
MTITADDLEVLEPAEEPSGLVSPGPLVPDPDFGPTDRLEGWAATVVVGALAALTRFMNLGSPTDAGTPIFDEKHYAPQAWQLLHNFGVEDNPGFGLVVHPPLGKQLIAIGEAAFGYTGVGWRLIAAVCGVILAVLVTRIVRRISRSTLIGAMAGLLVVADGVLFVASRTALLDIFMTVFVVGAFGALMVDRDQVRERMDVAFWEGRIAETLWGPRLGVRWWRFGAGVLLGLACATKWSGLYYVAFFGLMTMGLDVAARRAYRVTRPFDGMIRRDLGPTAYVFGVIPAALYLLSYSMWFASETAVNRYEAGQSIGPREHWWQAPDALRSLWHYTYKAFYFHSTLTNSAGNHHPWESKPWTWPMSLRPVLYAIDNQDVPGCGASSCVKAVLLVGTPTMWFIAVPVVLYAAWRTLVRRDWRYAVVLAGYLAGWLPWLGNIDRQMYFFYAVPLAPFLMMAIALILGDILYQPTRSEGRSGATREMGSLERQKLGVLVVCFYMALAITNFAWLFPVLTGIPVSQSTWNLEMWLPSWR